MSAIGATLCRQCGVELPVSTAPRSYCSNRCKMRYRTAGVHRCSRCGKDETEVEFSKDAKTQRGVQAWCKPCMKVYQKTRRHLSRLQERKSKYGISHEDQILLMESQDFQCAICSETIDFSAHLDHDHKSGRVRGFLCPGCNLLIGNAGESVPRLWAAVAYLERWA